MSARPSGSPPGARGSGLSAPEAAGRRTAIAGLAALALSVGCSFVGPGPNPPPPPSTFEKAYREAEAGDPFSQNLVGFMLFLGEMAPTDRALATHWFRQAALQGHVSAELNLSLIHYLGLGRPANRDEGERWLQTARSRVATGQANATVPASFPALIERLCTPVRTPDTVGERTFVTFCAGCHGLNGIAAYGDAPSFALGDRMDQNDGSLMGTVLGGHHVMPTWDDKLPTGLLEEALAFARSLEVEFRDGVIHDLRRAPGQYFLFGPMVVDSIAYQTDSALGLESENSLPASICYTTQ